MSMANQKLSRKSRIYLRLRRIESRIVSEIHAWIVGVWLGLLDPDDLAQVDALYYDTQTMYRDEAYNTFGLFTWESRLINDYFHGARRLLVTAAGGGREVWALCRMGFDVDAFECNADLAAFANSLLERDGLSARVRLAPRNGCPDLLDSYDGAIIGWGSFTLISSHAHRVAFLRDLRAVLPAGAPLMLSFFPRTGNERFLARQARIANFLRRLRHKPPVELGDDLVPNFAHHCSRAEIESALSAAGFELIHFGTEDYGHALARAIPIELSASQLSAEFAQPTH